MTCGCSNNEQSNDEVRPRRLIQGHKKSTYWQLRHNTGAIEAILQPSCSESNIPRQASTVAICPAMPNGVKKTTSKIKFGNEKTSSRYHKNCLTSSTSAKTKRGRNTIRRNVTTESCVDCPTTIKTKCGKFKNECYCVQPLSKPKIPGVPECTVPARNEEKSHLRRSDEAKYAYRPETLQLAKDIIDYVPQSAFLSRMYRENSKKCVCNACLLNAAGSNLKFTERRLHLEKAYHKLAECNRINFDKLSDLKCVNLSAINISPEDTHSCPSQASGPAPSRPQSRCTISDDDCCVRRSSRNLNTAEQIDAVKCIRKENYFETHSNLPTTSEVSADIKEHKCIFKFTINDRGLLEPLNPDAYGVNRCSICNKAQPEESPKNKTEIETEKEKMKDDVKALKKVAKTLKTPKAAKIAKTAKAVKAAKIKNKEAPVPSKPAKPSKGAEDYVIPQDLRKTDFEKYRERPFTAPMCKHLEIPLKVCNPSDEKIVHLDVKNVCNKGISNGAPKYMRPANSWALRFQKGCST